MYSRPGQGEWIAIKLEPHAGMRGRCSERRRPAPGYDRFPEVALAFCGRCGEYQLTFGTGTRRVASTSTG